MAIRAGSSPSCGCTQRIPASARLSASSTSGGAAIIGRLVTDSINSPCTSAPASASAASRLAATSRLASSAMSATCSPFWIARQVSTALCAPGSRSGEGRPKVIPSIVSRRQQQRPGLVVRAGQTRSTNRSTCAKTVFFMSRTPAGRRIRARVVRAMVLLVVGLTAVYVFVGDRTVWGEWISVMPPVLWVLALAPAVYSCEARCLCSSSRCS